MKRLLFLLPVLLLAGGCADRDLKELKSINAEQRHQVDQLLNAHQEALTQLSAQLDRQAQNEADRRTEGRTNELATGTMIVLGCALAVTLTMLLRKRGPTNANQPEA